MAQLQQQSPGRYVMKDLYLFSCKREILARKLETLPIKIGLKPIRPETDASVSSSARRTQK